MDAAHPILQNPLHIAALSLLIGPQFYLLYVHALLQIQQNLILVAVSSRAVAKKAPDIGERVRDC
jgi:hypothetical protein